MSVSDPVKLKVLRPIKNKVVVSDMKFGERYTAGGIFIPSDDGQIQGVHPRWGKVYAVGPDQKDVQPGQWILVAHGRWTRGIEIEDDDGKHTIRLVDLNDMLAVSDEEVLDENMGVPLTSEQINGAPKGGIPRYNES